MVIPAHTKYIILTILFVGASINFTRTAMEIIENSKRLDHLSQEVADLENQKVELEESVSLKKTDSYIEEKARNDLNLIKPGEKVYIIPKEFKESSGDRSILGQKVSFLGYELDNDAELSNLSKWLKVFLD